MKKIILKDNKEFIFDKMEFMGILNITPDSFYEGSRLNSIDVALKKAEKFINEGASFLDIGGESTRPGSEPVGVDEEIRRIVPVIKKIKETFPNTLISVDTYRSKTAKEALLAGADIINDISALTFDKDMVKIVKEFNVPIILMHMQGTPKNMQKDPFYKDVVAEVYDFLKKQSEFAIKEGISRDKIIIDLGIGFGKKLEHNVELLKNIDKFNNLKFPHLLAVSRKTFIGNILGEKDPVDRLFGTIGVSCYASMKNIEMARVHDIKENLEAVRIVENLKK